MANNRKLELGDLRQMLDRVPYALTLSDLSAEDQPLIYFNLAFQRMTGHGKEVLGQNCRFLQGDHVNDVARAEINLALSENRRTQVLLKNNRKNGEMFHNLLLLDTIGKFEALPELALGTQFDLGPDDPDIVLRSTQADGQSAVHRARSTALRLQLERRRIAADSAIRLLQSWYILSGVINTR